MATTAQGFWVLPNRKVFPLSPPSETGSSTVTTEEPLQFDPLPKHGISELEFPILAGHGPQRPMLCPYFLKNPQLVPEHSPCRLGSFEDVHQLSHREHIARDHNLPLQPGLVGDTELEKFQNIWMQIFPNHQENIPHPRLCGREFLRKQQNLRVIEIHETYILAKLNGQPGMAAILGKIFDDFRETFRPKKFGHSLLPVTAPTLRSCTISTRDEEISDSSTSKFEPEIKGSGEISTTTVTTQTLEHDELRRESSDLIRSYLRSINAEVVDKVMVEFWRIAEKEDWNASEDDSVYTTTDSTPSEDDEPEIADAGDGMTQTTGTSSCFSMMGSTTASSVTGMGQKRKSTDSGSHDDNNGGGDKRRRPDPSENPGPGSDRKRFGCPYFKKNPVKRGNNHGCFKPPGFKSVNRVKEHIYRVHHQRHECPRCSKEFGSPMILQSHLASEERCKKVIRQARPRIESITYEQETKLKSKTGLKGLPEEERWRKAYRILFDLPENCETPSPYYEEPTGLEKYDSFRRRRLPQLVREELANRGYLHLLEIIMSVVKISLDKLFSLFLEEEASGRLDDEEVDESGEDAQTEGINSGMAGEQLNEPFATTEEQISRALEYEEMGEMATPMQEGQGNAGEAVQSQLNEMSGNLPLQWSEEQPFLQDPDFEDQLMMGDPQQFFGQNMGQSYMENFRTFSEFPSQGD